MYREKVYLCMGMLFLVRSLKIKMKALTFILL
ncbi:hypothetical protein ACUXJ4_000119 [Bacillus pumilus]